MKKLLSRGRTVLVVFFNRKALSSPTCDHVPLLPVKSHFPTTGVRPLVCLARYKCNLSIFAYSLALGTQNQQRHSLHQVEKNFDCVCALREQIQRHALVEKNSDIDIAVTKSLFSFYNSVSNVPFWGNFRHGEERFLLFCSNRKALSSPTCDHVPLLPVKSHFPSQTGVNCLYDFRYKCNLLHWCHIPWPTTFAASSQTLHTLHWWRTNRILRLRFARENPTTFPSKNCDIPIAMAKVYSIFTILFRMSTLWGKLSPRGRTVLVVFFNRKALSSARDHSPSTPPLPLSHNGGKPLVRF